MVSSITNPSRAATLTLVGGELALDFANTSSGRGSEALQEHLQAAGDVVDWAAHARVLPPADADWLKKAAADDPALGKKLLSSALALREDVYEVGAGLAAGDRRRHQGRSIAFAPSTRIAWSEPGFSRSTGISPGTG